LAALCLPGLKTLHDCPSVQSAQTIENAYVILELGIELRTHDPNLGKVVLNAKLA
jgi:hypothetical protein